MLQQQEQRAKEAASQPPSEEASEQEVSGATDFQRKGRKFSLERDVYYFENNRREEVVTYDGSMHQGGKKLGGLATERGLSKAEQAAYKSSLGDLCAKLMTASRTSLNTTTSQR